MSVSVGESPSVEVIGPAPSAHVGHRLRIIAFDVVVAVGVMALALSLALRLSLPGGMSTLWLGGGALAAILALVEPPRWAPGIAAGLLAAFILQLSQGAGPGASAVGSLGAIGAVLVVATGIRRLRCLPLRTVSDVACVTGLAVGAGMIRVVFLTVTDGRDLAAGEMFTARAANLLLSAVLGVLVVTTFLVVMARPRPWRRPTRRQWAWGLALGGALLPLWGLLAFGPPATWWAGTEFVLFPLTIAAALALPGRAVATWLFAVSMLAAWAVIVGRGPFYRSNSDVELFQSDTLRAQAFLIMLALTAWVLSVVREEWVRAIGDRDRVARRLRVVVDQAAVPMAFGPLIGGPIQANQAMAKFFGVPQERMPTLDWVALTHPDDRDEDIRLTQLVIDGGQDSYRHLKRYVLEDGTLKWADVTVVRIDDTDSPVPWGVVQIIDMTAEMTARAEVARSEERFRTVVHKTSIPMSFGPVENGLAEVNDARCAFHERTREELARMDWRDLIHPEDLESMRPLHDGLITGEMDRYRVTQRFLMPDGRVKWGDVSVARVDLANENDDFVVVQVIDVTAEVDARARLQQQVDTDEISGLGSRSWITTALARALEQRQSDDSAVAAMFVDLSEYGVVTRNLGYEAGDEILASLAHDAGKALPEQSSIGRFWGDRFLVVIPDVADMPALEDMARKVLESIAAERSIHGRRIARTGSIGIALSAPGSTVTTILRSADRALTRAIQTGRSRWHVTHDHDSPQQGPALLRIEHDLREALDQGQFVLHYQPQVRLADSEITGYEALVRWQHPDRGLLSPAKFMDVMESSGLIVRLGRQVLARACSDIAVRKGLQGPVSVNVSAIEVSEPDWIDHVTNTLQRFDVPADRVTIELTETTLLRLTPDAQQALSAIRALGMGLHIDDFGMGYASIGSLLQVPLTGLKLDRRFVTPLAHPTQSDLDLVASIASMARGLRLEPLAEGIETPQQAFVLREAGWTHGQGYLYGRPGPLGGLDLH